MLFETDSTCYNVLRGLIFTSRVIQSIDFFLIYPTYINRHCVLVSEDLEFSNTRAMGP